jgi:hypothetical protein
MEVAAANLALQEAFPLKPVLMSNTASGVSWKSQDTIVFVHT